MNKTALLLIGVFLAGCASTKLTMYQGPFPAKEAADVVDIFYSSKPDKPYTMVGEITCSAASDTERINKIVSAAREIGADGVIIVGALPAAVLKAGGDAAGERTRALAIKYE
jgi:hypothetical protein